MAAGRVVAELGRPETPEETADRKTEASRVYRSSQTARNVVAALLATLAVVAVVVLVVPRGDAPARPPIDVAAAARQVQAAQGGLVVVPTVPADWSVNGAALASDGSGAWTVVYAPPGDAGFVRVAQAFGADGRWAAQVLGGAAAQDTVTIDGIVWDRYRIADPASAGNVAYALGTQAGPDHILIYGDMTPADAALVAGSLADQLRALHSPPAATEAP